MSGKSISPAEAKEVFGIRRLAARILELKREGVPIQQTLKADPMGVRYARYQLCDVDARAAEETRKRSAANRKRRMVKQGVLF